MIQMRMDRISPGEFVARAIYDDKGTPMVTAGTALTPELLKSLRARGYSSIYIMSEGTDDIEIEEYLRSEDRQRITGTLREKLHWTMSKPR